MFDLFGLGSNIAGAYRLQQARRTREKLLNDLPVGAKGSLNARLYPTTIVMLAGLFTMIAGLGGSLWLLLIGFLVFLAGLGIASARAVIDSLSSN